MLTQINQWISLAKQNISSFSKNTILLLKQEDKMALSMMYNRSGFKKIVLITYFGDLIQHGLFVTGIAYIHKVAITTWYKITCLQEECSFVSLRDVKRVLDVMSWFYGQRELLFRLMDERAERDFKEKFASDKQGKPEYKVNTMEQDTLLLIRNVAVSSMLSCNCCHYRYDGMHLL